MATLTKVDNRCVPGVYTLIGRDNGYGRPTMDRRIKSTNFVWRPNPFTLLDETLDGWNEAECSWKLVTTERYFAPVCKFNGLPDERTKHDMAKAIRYYVETQKPCFLGVAGGNSLQRWFCAIADEPHVIDLDHAYSHIVGDACPYGK